MANVIDKKEFRVYYDEADSIVIMEWAGYFTSDEFRKGTNEMLDTLRQFKAEKVLANVREMVLISIEDQKWMESVFLPKAIDAGFKLCALVKPLNYFNKVAVENITFKIDSRKLTVNLFENADEAKQWLRSAHVPEAATPPAEEKKFRVFYDEEISSVVMEWNGYFSTEQFREGSEMMLDVLSKHHCTKVLASIRNMILINSTDQKWLDEEFLPKAQSHGLAYCAIVKPLNHFNQVALQSVSGRVDRQKLQIETFESVEDARSWLKDQR